MKIMKLGWQMVFFQDLIQHQKCPEPDADSLSQHINFMLMVLQTICRRILHSIHSPLGRNYQGVTFLCDNQEMIESNK